MPDILSGNFHIVNDTTVTIKGNCKNSDEYFFPKKRLVALRNNDIKPQSYQKPAIPKTHGNIQYDLNYYSLIDTPFVDNGIYNHTLQTYFDIDLFKNIPVRFTVTSQRSNSSLFRNYTNVSARVNPFEYREYMRTSLEAKLKRGIKEELEIPALEQHSKSLRAQIAELNRLKNAPSQQQKIMEAREALYYQLQKQKEGQKNSIKPDNFPVTFGKTPYKFFNRAEADSSDKGSFEKKADGLQEKYGFPKGKYDSLRKTLAGADSALREKKAEVAEYKHKLEALSRQVNNVKDLDGLIKKYNLPDSVIPKGYRTALALRSFGLGRNMVDYSELSAKNVSINGVQAEFNPKFYYALAAGAIDYRFRNYVLQNTNNTRQFLAIFRVGKGMKNGNNIILTYFTGRRQLYNYSSSLSSAKPDYGLVGFTLEGKVNIARNHLVTAEAAKSSAPFYSGSKDAGLYRSITKVSDHSNEAYSLKINSFFPRQMTKLSGQIKYIGRNYQSFSLYTTSSAQLAWNIRADQFLFKKRLSLTAGIKTNEFNSPYLDQQFKTSTTFKTFQATLRMRKLPVVSIGYFPSSQLTRLPDNRYLENMFYTLNANITHFYKVKKAMATTSLAFTRFYNKKSDSGLVYFNTKNLIASQAFFIGKLSLQGLFTSASTTDYKLYTGECSAGYQFTNVVQCSGGMKYNKETTTNTTLLGYNWGVVLHFVRLGDIQVLYDKGYIPGYDRKLRDNSTGRLVYTKFF